MTRQYAIGIDIGTSGCKTILIDQDGLVITTTTKEYPIYIPEMGWTEQIPEDWWQATVEGIQTVISSSGVDPALIKGVGLSGQMHGMVAIDSEGQVIRPAILWNDQRTEKQCQKITELAGGKDQLLKLTNNLMLPGYTGGKILWLMENEPNNYKKTRMILNPKDYLSYKLSGDYATEVSDASGTGLFDVRNRTWSLKLLEFLEIPIEKLPKCYESTEVTGVISEEASILTGLLAGTKIVGGGGDSVIQTTGMGLIREGILGLTIGTAGISAMGIGSFKENVDGKLQIFCNNEKHLWHVMGVSLTSGGAFSWYKNNICKADVREAKRIDANINIYDLLTAEAAESPRGSKNLIFLPYLNGERCPDADPHAKASFIGLTLHHDKQDMTRSIIEGIIYSLRQMAEMISELDPAFKVSEIILSGGGSRSDLWRQICSDAFQIKVKTVSGSAEGGAYGAALVAGVGCGIWNNLEEATQCLKVETVNVPDPKAVKVYDPLFEIYKSLYPQLKETFKKLSFSPEKEVIE